jgi:Flp pilus assembly protein TadB
MGKPTGGDPMILLAALAGGLVAVGLVVLVAELTRRAPPPGTPPRPAMMRAGLTESLRRKILIGVVVGLAMLAVTRWPVAALAAGFGAAFLPSLMSTRGGRQRTAKLEGLEQWTRRVSDMLTASRGLEDALEVSARTAPPAIAPQVTALARRLSARSGTQEALRTFADEIDDPAGDRIVAALLIATSQRGGGVQGVLATLAELLARDVAARREIEASRAEHRTTLRWIIVFVCGFTLFAIFNRSYSAPYGTFTGEVVLALVAILYAVGLAWLNKLGQIPAPGRFLDQSPAGAGEPEPQPVQAGGFRGAVPPGWHSGGGW